ncbi:MAG: ergosterol biosynthesis protein, partial [Myxococcota bacterium]
MNDPESIAGFFAPWLMTLGITVLGLVLPGRWYVGYVDDERTGEKLAYRLNGWLVLLVSAAIWFGLGRADLVAYGWLYEHRWEGLAGAFTLGMIFTLAIVLPVASTTKARPVDA